MLNGQIIFDITAPYKHCLCARQMAQAIQPQARNKTGIIPNC